MKLEKSRVPKYYQLKHLLARQISDGTYPIGSRLPTVDAIAAEYNVSRVTANRAIMLLQDDDLLRSVPGVGSIVKDRESGDAGCTKPAWRDEHATKTTRAAVCTDGQVLFLSPKVNFSTKELLCGNIAAIVIAGLEGALMSADNSGNVIFLDMDWRAGWNKNNISRVIGDHKIAGIIVQDYGVACSFDDVDEMGRRVAELGEWSGLPVAFLGEAIWAGNCASVAGDDHECIRLLLNHLISLGHERILFAGLRPFLWSARREDAFEKIAAVRNLPVGREDIAFADDPEMPSEDQGYEVAKKRLASGDYTAVVAVNDHVAAGMVRAAEELGMSVPGDISIAGIDNWPNYRHLNLTTIHIPWDEMGVVALELLAKQQGGNTLLSQVLVRPRLIVRRSTAKCPIP